MANLKGHQRWYAVYALVIGVAGILTLSQLFAGQETPIDLFTTLLFAVVALVLSYFRVPVRGANAEIGLDGAVLLGAALLGGPALGGWVAFIAGLIKGFFPQSLERDHWFEKSAAALWSSGRNVLSIAAAWGAYIGMGGTLSPVEVDTPLALAVFVLCVVFALVRCFVAWPALVLQGGWSKRAVRDAVNATTFLLEVAPLPTSLLISATAAQLGTSYFLLLALILVGLGAVMKRMLDLIGLLRRERDTLAFASLVNRTFATTPSDIQALCNVAYQLCAERIPSARFEIGLYNAAADDLHIEIAVHNEADREPGKEPTTRLPPMRVPVPPLWEWIREQHRPLLLSAKDGISDVPFAAPQEGGTQSLMIVPLLKNRDVLTAEAEEDDEERPPPMGALLLHAPAPTNYEKADAAYVEIVAGALSEALQNRAIQLPGEASAQQ